MSLLHTCTLRPQDPPPPGMTARGLVTVYHPKQNSPSLPLLLFPVFPVNPDLGAAVGIPVGLVLDACCILGNNRRGELQLLDMPHQRVADEYSDPDRLLSPGRYLFVVVTEERHPVYDYSVCSSFDYWVPPAVIPLRWKGQEPARAPDLPYFSPSDGGEVILEDDACIVTGATSCLESSHIVPATAVQWCRRNRTLLYAYGGDPLKDIKSARNVVTLRSDLDSKHMDSGLFVFAPFAGRIVPIFLKPTAGDLAYNFHMKEVGFPDRILRGYLFVRFAWDIFKFHAPGLAAAAWAQQMLPHQGPLLNLKRSSSGRDQQEGASKKAKTSGDGRGSHTDEAALLAVYEAVDENLQKQPYLTGGDAELGFHVGFSSTKRLEFEYRRAHPEVSAVGSTQFWEDAENKWDDWTT
ncbi:hypothetical protein FB45DRAFT_1114356 [Roridomyces roridus]|uniref:HNH nuclease domain-containing protein n=1 Tax=Roridomyces roridus TaxID=1738132 RepID=A0AAD7CBA0_9AGAR|nr:hypothetical protein FB45DRAFT_1114356 [Roridomyces roridus]